MHRQENEAFDPPKDLNANMSASRGAPWLRRLVTWFDWATRFLVRMAGVLMWGAVFLFFLVPPVLLLVLFSFGGYRVLADLTSLDLSAVLLTATGTTAALAALCFSYSRAVEHRTSKHAGLASGRMFLGATVALAVAMAAHVFDAMPTISGQVDSNAFRRFVIDNSLEITFRLTPLLVCLAVLRMYLHLLRLAGLAFMHSSDSREGRAEREKLRLFD